ncbi:MAG: type 2 isopentenyl-diphosphate Delta-isomerase [bacterium]
MLISKRKSEHIQISLNQDVCFRNKTSGFETYELVHCALPEMDVGDVCTMTDFLGKRLSLPLMICGMTGGSPESEEINSLLAEACREEGAALGVGSQRQILENHDYLESYRIARRVYPDGVIVGNVGAVEVATLRDISPFRRMVDLLEANAMAVHLNPLQEVLQPEGEARFRGVLEGIERLVRGLGVPVIVKEVGCGISEAVARRLVDAGVEYIDVAGAGGTSWAGVESHWNTVQKLALRFWDWGIPTAESLRMVARIRGARVIASGGIRDGVTMAKALALGSDLCGAALPFLRALMDGKVERLISLIQSWREELRTAMFLTGCRRIGDLRRKGILIKKE